MAFMVKKKKFSWYLLKRKSRNSPFNTFEMGLICISFSAVLFKGGLFLTDSS